VTSPLLASRAPSGHTEESTPASWPGRPSWAFIPYSACGEAGSVIAGLPHPPPSVLSVSHALDGLHPATPVRACFIPVTLMGFRLQGFAPPGEPYLFRGQLLSCRSNHNPKPLSKGRWPATSESCSLRRVLTAAGRNPGDGRCPPGVRHSKALSNSAVGSASRSLLPCTSHQARASEFSPAET